MYSQRKNFKHNPMNLTNMLDNFMNSGWEKLFDDDNRTSVSTPVNIKETEDAYHMEVVAPGLKKELFNINIDKDILTISFEENNETTEEKEDKYIRREYSFRSFKRSFTLTDKIDSENISAKYEDGILNLELPKVKVEVPKAKKIVVA